MSTFEVQFDFKGSLVVSAKNLKEAEMIAKRKLDQYRESMKLHFQKDIDVRIEDIESVS